MTSVSAGEHRPKTFVPTLAALTVGAVLASVLMSPIVAVVVARLGLHFPFSRIFDRVAMAAVTGALLYQHRRLAVGVRLRRGFAQPRRNCAKFARGLVVGTVGVAVLWLLQTLCTPPNTFDLRQAMSDAPAALATGLAVGVIEEAFFRAFLLDGLQEELGAMAALVASAAIYAVAHLVRTRTRVEIRHLNLAAGARNLERGLRGLTTLRAFAGFVGLFLLGLVLGRGFQVTATVYFSAGFHAGVVFAWKSGRRAAAAAPQAAHWVWGYGWPPLVSGAAAWVMLCVALPMVGRLSGAPLKRQSS
jgi:membrane protease YdiL (CAAX protease family)